MKIFPSLLLSLGLCVSGELLAQAAAPAYPNLKPADHIVAVVNDEVITQVELTDRLELALRQLRQQGTSLPPRNELERQMLERMIIDKLQLQHAREIGLHVDDAQLEQTLQRIAANNNMSMEQFRETLQRDGIPFANFREEIRNEMTIARVREREVDNRIVVSEGEIDNFLNSQATGSGNQEYDVSHILLRLPEGATPEQIQRTQAKADDIYRRLQAGEDFAQMAAAYSDAPDGLRGGSLGARPLDRMPGIFAEAVVKLAPGQLAPILRSSNGFHIVKLLAKGGAAVPPQVQQTHARHILIKVNELVSDAEAKRRLDDLHERLKNGAKFEELARLFSQDGSAAKGGDLGWLYPGDTVPDFERVMDQLAPGEISVPIRSPFGYHLVQVLERRMQDVSDERKRAAAREALKERKLDEAYQDWLRQERDRAYVDIRLDEH